MKPWLTESRLIDGKPGPDRSWKECFAQLRGTVLSLWDAQELDDAAGQSSNVMPAFINLTDASIKMVSCRAATPLPNGACVPIRAG
jgi:hypothetical protein